jgi:hypothetical protein
MTPINRKTLTTLQCSHAGFWLTNSFESIEKSPHQVNQSILSRVAEGILPKETKLLLLEGATIENPISLHPIPYHHLSNTINDDIGRKYRAVALF